MLGCSEDDKKQTAGILYHSQLLKSRNVIWVIVIRALPPERPVC